MPSVPSDGQPEQRFARLARLRELLDKYDLLLALSAGEPGRTVARRNAIRLIAQRFPGAMREWDELPHAELVRRREHVAAQLAEGVLPSDDGEPWLRFAWLLHAELRALLAIRRLLIDCKQDPPEQLLELARERCQSAGAEGLAQRLTATLLTGIATRPGARLSELAYQAVADEHGVSVAAVKQAIFAQTSDEEPADEDEEAD